MQGQSELLDIHSSNSSKVPPPAFLSFPCLTSSSQMAGGNWLGGMMAVIPELRPLLNGPPPILDSASRRVSFKRFLNALRAAFKSCCVGVAGSMAISHFSVVVSCENRRLICRAPRHGAISAEGAILV